MVTKSDFVLEWDKALGFKGDPFADKIFAPINKFLVNRKEEREKMNWFFIKNYYFGAMVGEPGVGKTTMLKWLEDRLTRYNRIHAVYLNAAVFKEQVNILHKMVIPLLSFYERKISKVHKKMLSADLLKLLKKKLGHKSAALLIDNAHHLTDKNLEMVKGFRKEGLKLQVVVTSTPKEYEKSRLREIGQDEMSITLRRLTFEESQDLIQRRVHAFGGRGIYPFTEAELKKLYEKADKNPRELLKICRDEAIKILIHKRELLDKKTSKERAEAKPLKTSAKREKIKEAKPKETSGKKMDVNVRKASKEEAREEREDDDKKVFRIRFALGKDDDEPRRKKQKHVKSVHQPGRRAIHDDEHKQDLLNQMSSTSPRRKDEHAEGKPKKDDEGISETDKLLRELAEEFEVD